MRPVHIDTLSVVLIAAPLVVWAGCLTVLWGWAFDSSGASMLIGLPWKIACECRVGAAAYRFSACVSSWHSIDSWHA